MEALDDDNAREPKGKKVKAKAKVKAKSQPTIEDEPETLLPDDPFVDPTLDCALSHSELDLSADDINTYNMDDSSGFIGPNSPLSISELWETNWDDPRDSLADSLAQTEESFGLDLSESMVTDPSQDREFIHRCSKYVQWCLPLYF
jgi:hypothetical protein